jgi:hypothetical protein
MWSVVALVILGELMIVFITLAVAHDSDRVRSLVMNNAAMYAAGILIGWWLL